LSAPLFPDDKRYCSDFLDILESVHPVSLEDLTLKFSVFAYPGSEMAEYQQQFEQMTPKRGLDWSRLHSILRQFVSLRSLTIVCFSER